MDRYTTELGRMLRDDPLPEVTADEALRVVRHRAARRKRRGSVTLAAGVAAAVGGIGIAAVVLPTASINEPSVPSGTPTVSKTASVDTAGAVPWSDRTDFTPWHPPAPESRSTAAPCTSGDLRVRRIDSHNVGRETDTLIALVKTTAGRCTLAGYPGLTGTDENRFRGAVPVDHDPAPPQQSGETPATLEQHEIAEITVTDGQDCQPGQGGAAWTDLALTLRDGSQLPLGRDVTARCMPTVSRFYRDNAPIEQPSRWPGIQATLKLPESVTPGQVVDYVVELHNGTDRTIKLVPCGGYRQQVRVVGAGYAPVPVRGGRTEYRLNCSEEPTLAAGETRRYAMRLTVPDTAAGSEVLFTWGFLDNSPDHEAQQWVTLADETGTRGNAADECAAVPPRSLPGGGPVGRARSTTTDYGDALAWGVGRQQVIQLPGSNPLDIPNDWPDSVPIRDTSARVVALGDPGEIAFVFTSGRCTYTNWIGPGYSLADARKYISSY